MDFRIKGRNALITGGSMGIGRATAVELSREGVNVAICARNAERAHAAAAEIAAETRGRVVAVPGDLSRADEVERVVDATREALGGIDILVNNAGASPAGRIHELTDDQWRASFDLKLMGYVRCARAVLPGMKERRWGRIINVTGRGGELATPTYLLGGFNAAATHFSRALALEAAPHKVLVNAVSPGGVNTARIRSIVAQKSRVTGRSEEEIAAQWNATVPLGAMAEPEDVADLITFLCSERARHIVGAVVHIDGGGMGGV